MDAEPKSTPIDLVEFLDAQVSRRGVLSGFGKGMLALGVSSSIVSILEACQASTSSVSTGPIDTLTWSQAGTAKKIDLFFADVETYGVNSLGLESLLAIQDDGSVKPALASSWSQPDPLTYVFKLRQGVKFWDGTPLTVDDVTYSLKQLSDPKGQSQWSFFWSALDNIAATASDEITIKLKTPFPGMKWVCAFGGSRIVSKAFWQAHTSDIGTPGVLTMGTGPFKFTSLKPDESVTLVRNEGYWGDKPNVKNIVINFIPDDATRQLAMRSGSIDGGFEIPLDQTSAWQKIPHTKVEVASGQTTVMFALNTQTAPFNDVHVRRAFAHCIDRAGIVSAVLHGNGTVAPCMVPTDSWGDVNTIDKVRELYAKIPQYEFNIDMAKAELAQSSHPNGFTIEIWYPDVVARLGLLAQAVAASLKQIGITMNVKEVPNAQWLNQQYNMQGPIHVFFFIQDYPDPSEFPFLLMASSGAVVNGFNFAQYKNAEIDDLLSRYASASDNPTRFDLLSKMLNQAASDIPYPPVWFQDIAVAVKDQYTYRNLNAFYVYQDWASHVVRK